MSESFPASDIEARLRKLESRLDQKRPARSKMRLASSFFLATLAGAAVVGITWWVHAQVGGNSPAPGVMNYQGQLTDAAGNPFSGYADITFRLYNVSEGGAALWTEAHTELNAVAVTSGHFSTLLGSIQPIPGDVIASSPLYLGITVGSYAEMTPRQPVGVVANVVADGSITGPKIGAGAVTTDKIALNAVTNVAYAHAWWLGTDELVVPPGDVWTWLNPTPDNPDSPFVGTFTTSGGDLLILGDVAKMSFTGTEHASFNAMVDDHDQSPTQVMCAHNNPTPTDCSGFIYLTGVPAGTHTIKPVAQGIDGTVTVGPYGTISMLVLELKR